jgi:hypothetical protein
MLSSVAQALRQTAQNLQGQNQAAVGGVANQAADRVDQVAGYLRERDVSQLVGEFEGYARRSPGLVLGGAFALGLLAARFVKSSSPSRGGAGTGYGSYGGQFGSYGGSQSQYGYQNAPYRYDDVQGMPNVQRRYSPGMTGSGSSGAYGSAGGAADTIGADYAPQNTGYDIGGTGEDAVRPSYRTGPTDFGATTNMARTSGDMDPAEAEFARRNPGMRTGDGA